MLEERLISCGNGIVVADREGTGSAETVRWEGWNRWHWAAVAGMVVVAVAATYDAWADMAGIVAFSQESSYVALVPVAFALLVWTRRYRLGQCRQVGTYIGPAMAAVGWVVSSIGYTHAIQSFWHGGAVMVVVGCAAAVLGGEVILQLLPAFAVLVLLVPIPGTIRQEVAGPLYASVAAGTYSFLGLLGYNVAASGDVLVVAGTSLHVGQASNGIWMLMATGLMGYAFAFGTSMQWYARLAIIAMSPLLAVACNVLLLVVHVWLQRSSNADIMEAYGVVGGWLMLSMGLLLLFGLSRLLHWVQVLITVDHVV